MMTTVAGPGISMKEWARESIPSGKSSKNPPSGKGKGVTNGNRLRSVARIDAFSSSGGEEDRMAVHWRCLYFFSGLILAAG